MQQLEQELVLEVYRITLLSNLFVFGLYSWQVLEVYRITLLSNESPVKSVKKGSFRGL